MRYKQLKNKKEISTTKLTNFFSFVNIYHQPCKISQVSCHNIVDLVNERSIFISRDIKLMSNVTDIVCFQKISRPHHGKNWKFWRGQELEGLRNSIGVRGLKTKIHFQRGTYNDCFSGTLVGFSGAFVGHGTFFLPFSSCKWLWLLRNS